MKKIMTVTVTFLLAIAIAQGQSQPTIIYESGLDSQLLVSFQKSHPTRAHVTWWTDKNHVQASFSENNIQWVVTFDQYGKWQKTIKRYRRGNLNNDVVNLLTESFSEFEINSVTELLLGCQQIYYINLSSEARAKQVAVYNMEISVQQEFDLK